MKNYNDYQLTQKQLSRISYYKKRSFIARSLRKHGVMPTDEQIANVTAVTEGDVQVYKPVFYTTEQYQEEFTVGPESLEHIDDGGEVDWDDSGTNSGVTPTDVSGDTTPEETTATTIESLTVKVTLSGCSEWQFSGILYTDSGLTEGIHAENWVAKDYRDQNYGNSNQYSCTITGATAATIYGMSGIWFRASGTKTLTAAPQVRVGGRTVTAETYTSTSATFTKVTFENPIPIQNSYTMIYFAKP